MAFPLVGINRRTIRAPVNELDKSTVVSIYPRDIIEVKPTIQPGRFHIKAGTMKNPSLLVVGPSSWWKELDEQQPFLEIPTGSIQIADSIVKDWANGLFACNMGDRMPGLFYVPGEQTLKKVQTDYTELLHEANVKQRNWFATLVEHADTLWSQSGGSPLSISENMKIAAHELGLRDKPWLRDFHTMQLEDCPSCGELYDAKFPVCKSCHQVINKKLYKELGLSPVEA